MTPIIRNLALACVGSLLLSGCQYFMPTSKDSQGTIIASTGANEPQGQQGMNEPETVIFYPAANPPWAHINVGKIACAEGRSFQISRADVGNNLDLNWKGKEYTLHNVATTSGAFRYEDKVSGLVLIQIPAKLLLLNSKQGERLADECKPD